MAYQHFNNGFHICSRSYIDDRLVLTKEEMRTETVTTSGGEIVSLAMPDKYFALCKDDNKIYYYDRSAPLDPVTGRFKEVISGGEEPERYDEVLEHIDDTAGNPHNITPEKLGLADVATSGDYEDLINIPPESLEKIVLEGAEDLTQFSENPRIGFVEFFDSLDQAYYFIATQDNFEVVTENSFIVKSDIFGRKLNITTEYDVETGDTAVVVTATAKVIANPTLAGDEEDLTSIEIDGTKYAINNSSGTLERDFTTDITVGHIKASTPLAATLTISELLYNMLSAGTPIPGHLYTYEGTTLPQNISDDWSENEIILTNYTMTVYLTGGITGFMGIAYPASLGDLAHIYQNDLHEFDLITSSDLTKTLVTYNDESYLMYLFTDRAVLAAGDKWEYVLGSESPKVYQFEGATNPTAIDSTWTDQNIELTDKEINFTFAGGVNEYIAFAYPSSMGTVSHVYQNHMSFDLINDVIYSTVTYNNVQYNLYKFLEIGSVAAGDTYQLVF